MIIKYKYKLVALFLMAMATCLMAQQSSQVMPLADEVLLLSVTDLGDSLVAVGERGHVLKSTDKGETWRQIEHVPVNILLTKVYSVNQSVWAVGHDATVIHSQDGGETWEIQFYDPDRQLPLLSVYFMDEQNGFAIGAYGTILITNDGGQNWQDELIHDELDYHLNDITMANNGNLYIAGEAGYGFMSSDKGQTWEAIELPYPGSMFGVLALQDEVLMFGLRGHVLSSRDQGSSWQSIPNNNLSSLFGGDRIDGQSAVFVGANGARIIYKNQQLVTISGSSALEIGDDYSDVMLLDKGQKILLLGEEGSDIQTLNQP